MSARLAAARYMLALVPRLAWAIVCDVWRARDTLCGDWGPSAVALISAYHHEPAGFMLAILLRLEMDRIDRRRRQ